MRRNITLSLLEVYLEVESYIISGAEPLPFRR